MLRRILVPALFACNLFAGDFARNVYPALEKAGCAGCHNDNGVASGTRLKFPEGKQSEDYIESFGRSLHILVDRKAPAQSLLLNKPTNRIAHAGGKRIQPASDDEKALQRWVEYLAKAPAESLKSAAAETHGPAGPVLRRLTHSQYNNTVRDLLGDESRIADQFVPEDFVNGFKNQFEAQNTSPLLAEAYSMAAEKLAKKAFLGGDTQSIVPCAPKTFADAACRDRFLATFGRKAFRRPLTAAETARYQKLFAAEAAAKKDFLAAAQLTVEVMLQSPNFLLRAENGVDAALRPYEIASRLSYFLWNTMPDDALLQAAASGGLATREGVEKQARRMLQSPKAREAVDEFLAQWMRFDRLTGTVRDRRQYPQFSNELTYAMIEETRRVASDLVWNGRNFMDFFSSPETFVNSDLARLYKLPQPKLEYEKLVHPESSGRGGILGHASFLALTSKPAETSITARGLFVREQFLCQEVPQPPPGVDVNLPAVTKERPMTQRERLGVHLSNEACASCHTLIDPIGYGLEKFDAIGAFREKMRLTVGQRGGERNEEAKTFELALDTTGTVAGIANSAFASPRELGMILAGSAQCQQCVAKQVFRYLSGRHESPADKVMLQQAFDDFRLSGFKFQELMVSLVKWSEYPPMRMN